MIGEWLSLDITGPWSCNSSKEMYRKMRDVREELSVAYLNQLPLLLETLSNHDDVVSENVVKKNEFKSFQT